MDLKYLSDIEKEALASFAMNKILVNAVEKVILSGVYFNGTLKAGEAADPERNFALSFQSDTITNEKLGENLRGAIEGIRLVYLGMNKLRAFAPEPKTKKEGKNPAR